LLTVASQSNDDGELQLFDESMFDSDKQKNKVPRGDNTAWCAGCSGKAGFFCRHSCRDMCRSKCNFCLAFFSVLIVVLSTLLIKTITNKGPIVFLKIGETSSGQYDAVITPTRSSFNDFDDFTDSDGIYLNYTQVTGLYENKYNLAPRK